MKTQYIRGLKTLGPENKCRTNHAKLEGPICSTGKCGTETAGLENAGLENADQ